MHGDGFRTHLLQAWIAGERIGIRKQAQQGAIDPALLHFVQCKQSHAGDALFAADGCIAQCKFQFCRARKLRGAPNHPIPGQIAYSSHVPHRLRIECELYAAQRLWASDLESIKHLRVLFANFGFVAYIKLRHTRQ